MENITLAVDDELSFKLEGRGLFKLKVIEGCTPQEVQFEITLNDKHFASLDEITPLIKKTLS